MPSNPEALAALVAAALAGVAGAKPLRGGVLPETIPAGGLINLVEGEPVEIAELIGGAREFMLELDVELAVAEADDAARALALDVLAQAAAAAVLGSAGLASAADHRRVHPLRDRQDIAQPGAAALRVATLPVEIHYTTSQNPMEAA